MLCRFLFLSRWWDCPPPTRVPHEFTIHLEKVKFSQGRETWYWWKQYLTSLRQLFVSMLLYTCNSIVSYPWSIYDLGKHNQSCLFVCSYRLIIKQFGANTTWLFDIDHVSLVCRKSEPTGEILSLSHYGLLNIGIKREIWPDFDKNV